MILWCDGAHDPAENMRRDVALLEAVDAAARRAVEGAAGAEAVLRLFRFAPAGITLGRAQNPARALDLARCERDGVRWAVRPTGGRAIFHADEWTYSIAAPIADPDWGGTLTEAYARASALVAGSLLRLGVEARLAAGGRATAPAGRAPDACFAATARHEIVLAGRKLVGSAQRRTAHALLQQGSVLLGPGHLRLAEYLAIPDASRAAARRALEISAAHAGDRLGSAPPLERWAEALAAELPAGTRRLDAEAGAFQLTLAERGSYTPRAS